MTQIKIDNKTSFINNFLSPVSKLTENTVIKVRENEFTALSSSSDGTLIVSCTMPQKNVIDETVFLNIPDLNKLIKVLACVDQEDISLGYNNNNIEYKSNNVGFRYHLLEDGIIDPPAVDINRIKQIDFNFKFNVSSNTINQLVKGSTFTTDTNKIYFFTQDDHVMADLTDKQRHNIDSYTQQVADSYSGDSLSKPLALSFETIRIVSSIRFDKLKVNVNPELNVFLFQLQADNTTILIVSSGFVG